MKHTKNRKNLFWVALVTILITIFLYTLAPRWWKVATIQDFNKWYPLFGSCIYYFKIIVPYLAITTTLFLVPWEKLQLSIKNNRRRTLYLFILIVLIGQFIFSREYREPFPSVMMPLFSDAKYHDIMQYSNASMLVTTFKNEKLSISIKDLMGDFKGRRPSQVYLFNTFIRVKKPMDAKSINWLRNKLIKLLKRKDLKSVTILKVTRVYAYKNRYQFITRIIEPQKTYELYTEDYR